jgi:hypothetical protein
VTEVFVCWEDVLWLVLFAVFIGCAIYCERMTRQSRDAYKAALAKATECERERSALDLLAQIKGR